MTDIQATTWPKASDDLPLEPYPGVRPFEPDEWQIFIGRDQIIEEVIKRLEKSNLVVLHGEAGSGKSSLLRAGLTYWLPFVDVDSKAEWKFGFVRLGLNPINSLARVLTETIDSSSNDYNNVDANWRDLLALGKPAWIEIQNRLESKGIKLCLIIDHFEETISGTHHVNREEVQVIVQFLRAISSRFAPRLFIVVTLRSNSLGLSSRYPGLSETVDQCHYLLPPMDDAALLRTIHEPSELYDGSVDLAVSDLLLYRLRRETTPLPFLQHVLMRAFRCVRRRYGLTKGWKITLDDVKAVTGENGAISEHGDEILRSLVADDPRNGSIVEWLFRSIIEFDEAGSIRRRWCSIRELAVLCGSNNDGVVKVIQRFLARDCAFLDIIPPEPIEESTIVSLSQEAVVKQWHRLWDDSRDPQTNIPRGWIKREVEDAQVWRGLAVLARRGGQDFVSQQRLLFFPIPKDWCSIRPQEWAARYATDSVDFGSEYRRIMDMMKESLLPGDLPNDSSS